MVVFGTRPEAIKMAPVVLALAESSVLEPVVVVTAQHRAMLDQVLELFDIKPDFDLDIIRERQTLTGVTLAALGGLSPLVESEAPAALLVQGDTTTTLTAALAAFYHQIPVVHLEAGLRTGDRLSPYPEEVNRRLTTQLSSLHLAPTSTAKSNLLAENVDASSIVVTGNTVIDALLWTVERCLAYGDPALDDLDDDNRRVLLVTAHRRESWGVPMDAIGQALAEIATAEPDLVVVFPIHANPVVRHSILPAVKGLANVRVVEPLAYGGFARLMVRSHLILTDSGGIQEEGPSLGKPVLVMRDKTERPEGVSAGTVRLVGTRRLDIVTAVSQLLHEPGAHAAMANAVNPYGDGRAAERTVAAVAHLLGDGPPPDEFQCPSRFEA
ncbi:MAG: UDP-N-acetylglucosamine 2-epimerase (non-hydrolyzing) [Acidimicrobiales bacterium]|nr:MAG: UDP-N-acetylglucosamine 2-epimerase (non-hydrolyzing) [Acidimicrobiales bacterium]